VRRDLLRPPGVRFRIRHPQPTVGHLQCEAQGRFLERAGAPSDWTSGICPRRSQSALTPKASEKPGQETDAGAPLRM
jgi:hypothetical protein